MSGMEGTDGFENGISQALEGEQIEEGLTWRRIPMHGPGQRFFTAFALA